MSVQKTCAEPSSLTPGLKHSRHPMNKPFGLRWGHCHGECQGSPPAIGFDRPHSTTEPQLGGQDATVRPHPDARRNSWPKPLIWTPLANKVFTQ